MFPFPSVTFNAQGSLEALIAAAFNWLAHVTDLNLLAAKFYI
jgi:hypothetical protein